MKNVQSSVFAVETQRSRKPYTTPSLEGLGAVSDLVMGGGTLSNEGSPTAMAMAGGM